MHRSLLQKLQFLPGEEVPQSGAYQEHELPSGHVVRRLLLLREDIFPRAHTAGGFFTLMEANTTFWSEQRVSSD